MPRPAGSRSGGAGAPAPASGPPGAAPRPWPSAAVVGSSGAAPGRGRAAARTPRTPPGGVPRPDAVGPPSELFLHGLLEHELVQGELGDQPLEAFVLGLQLLEAL